MYPGILSSFTRQQANLQGSLQGKHWNKSSYKKTNRLQAFYKMTEKLGELLVLIILHAS